jgi:hypothetical protein
MSGGKDLGSFTLNHGPKDWTSLNTKVLSKAHGGYYHHGGGLGWPKKEFFLFSF